MPSAKPLRIASVNVNGVRAAFRKGMGEWLAARDVDILAMQEVRASTEDLQGLLGDEWDILHDPATAKGRAGVAHREPQPRAASTASSSARPTSTAPAAGSRPTTRSAAACVTVVSAYVHSGEAGTPKQVEKYRFLDAMERADAGARRALRARRRRRRPQRRPPHARHPQLEGQREAGRLPARRARLLRPLRRGRGRRDDYNAGAGLGWVDVGRSAAGEVDGPVHLVVDGAARRSTTTPGGASTTSSRRRRSPTTVGRLRGRPGGRLRPSDGPTTPPSSSTTPSDHSPTTRTPNT